MSSMMSRRNLVGLAGVAAAGAAVGRLTGGAAEAAAVPGWPWPYVRLDPGETAELAYSEWGRLFCGAAVIHGVFAQLATRVGEPYASFPVEAFLFLEGGVSGWGTVCGCCAGANVVSNLIAGPRTAASKAGMQIGSEVLAWYAETPLPTFRPARLQSETCPVTTAGSPLCHVSVGRWMKIADKGMGSPERRERCARITASVTFRLVELLNAWKDGTFDGSGPSPAKEFGIPAQPRCGDCHADGAPPLPGGKA